MTQTFDAVNVNKTMGDKKDKIRPKAGSKGLS